jgi:acetyl-CoA C-acetyltransferase
MSDMNREPVIVAAARTPIGKFLGGLSALSAPELGAAAIRAALERSKVPADQIEEVIMGNVIQGGVGQAPARQAAIKGGVPETVSALTINKVCGSGLKAVMLAAQSIKAGDRQVVAVLRLRHAQRREARRPADGRWHDQGRSLVRVL